MSAPKHLSLIVVVFCLASLIGAAEAKVRATAILFRHGERTPVFSIPGLNNELAEDIGYGQLTNVRKQFIFNLIFDFFNNFFSSFRSRLDPANCMRMEFFCVPSTTT